MKTVLFFLAIITLASCSTAYKSGQTPDDIYYSKGRTVVENKNRYERIDRVYEDRQIRMAAYDYRWRTLDAQYDYDYRYNPYSYGYNYGYYYNPYYCSFPVYNNNVVFVNPKNTTIRTANLNSYNNNISVYTPTKSNGNLRTTVVRGYNNDNNQTIRNTDYRIDNNSNRTYTPSSSNNNSNNNSNSAPPSTGTPVQRPSRGQ